MTSYSNGRLPQSVLAPIAKAANGEQAYLRKDVAAAFNAMNSESERRFGVTLRATSARCAYRPIADQEYFWDQYLHHGGNLAAEPGESNHGLGTTFDLATERMRQIVDQIGAKYGFAKRWSDAPTEWWHIKWSPEHVTASGRKAIAAFADPLKDYTATEIRLIREHDRLKRNGKGPLRLKVIKAWFVVRRKAIHHVGEYGSGWAKFNRRARYKSLLARSR